MYKKIHLFAKKMDLMEMKHNIYLIMEINLFVYKKQNKEFNYLLYLLYLHFIHLFSIYVHIYIIYYPLHHGTAYI